jgi:hypothetical protein
MVDLQANIESILYKTKSHTTLASGGFFPASRLVHLDAQLLPLSQLCIYRTDACCHAPPREPLNPSPEPLSPTPAPGSAEVIGRSQL